MPQIQLPIFPDGTTAITNELAFERQNGTIIYFYGTLPIFSHIETNFPGTNLKMIYKLGSN